jgi:hypothetical protein
MVLCKGVLFLFVWQSQINPLNTELNIICHLLALLEAHNILHVIRIRVKQAMLKNFP